MNFAKEDAADDLQLNEIIWRSCAGKNTACRARCVRPLSSRKKDHDDD